MQPHIYVYFYKHKYIHTHTHTHDVRPFEFQDKSFLLHIVSQDNYKTYEPFLMHLNICDNAVVSSSLNLEQLALSSLEEKGYYGFFVSDIEMTFINAFVIIDLNCTTTIDKIPEGIHIDIHKCVEIVLFCSNKVKKVSNLASFLFSNVLHNFIPMFKRDCKYVLLIPADKDRANLERFYAKFQFRTLMPSSSSLMILDLHPTAIEAPTSSAVKNKSRRKSFKSSKPSMSKTATRRRSNSL